MNWDQLPLQIHHRGLKGGTYRLPNFNLAKNTT